MQGEGTWGHRNSRIFQRGKASPFDPCSHCVDVAGFLLWGIRARQLVLFSLFARFVLDCGRAGMWCCEFISLPLHNMEDSPYSSDSDAFHFVLKAFSYSRQRLKYIYFDPDGCAPHGTSWWHPPKAIPKTWRRHRGENLHPSIFLIFWRGIRFLYLESAYGYLSAQKLRLNVLYFQSP